MMTRLLFFFAALLAALPAAAQTTHLVPKLVTEGPVPQEGGTIELALVFETEPGWHGYWLNPGDAGLPLDVKWQLPEGATLGPLHYPTPMSLEAAGLVNYVYKDDHAILTRLTVPATNRSVLTVAGEARWLACTDTICVPERGNFRLALPVGDGPSRQAEFDAYRQKLPSELAMKAKTALADDQLRIAIPLPGDLPTGKTELFLGTHGLIDYAAPQTFRRKGDVLIVELARREGSEAPPQTINGVLKLGNGRGLAFVGHPGEVPTGGKLLNDLGTEAILLALLGALAGGIVLNLMPCVLPVLAMKAMHLARAGGEAEEARREALGYTAGAVVGTAALGGILLLIRAGGSAAGWAFQLQDSRTIFFLLLLATAISLNLLGVFRLPVLGGSLRPAGSFSTGALAAFVATPCAGPFLGVALGTALILPPLAGVGVFATMGLGLALPFLAIAFIPPLRERLPRPGPWMVTLQRYLAIPMLATVAACLWLISRLAGDEALYLSLGAVLAFAALLWLIGKRPGAGWLGLVGIVGLAGAGMAMLPDRPSREAVVPEGAEVWSEAAVAKARAEGHPVLAYFSADWCVTCKYNERTAIYRDETKAAFKKAGVVIFAADWTDGDPVITRFLEEQGRAGVPLTLWYEPGTSAPEVLPQIITTAMLTERAGRARP